MPFVDAMEVVDAARPARPGKAYADLVTLIQMVAFGVVGFGIIILTARSIFTALNKPVVGLSLAGAALGQFPGAAVGSAGSFAASGQPGRAWYRTSPGEGVHPEGDEDDGLTLRNIQGQMRASSVRKVVSSVDEHPDTTLGIIRA